MRVLLAYWSSATQLPLTHTSGAQHWALSVHPPHVPLLHACPPQSRQLPQVVGGAHVELCPDERIAWS